MQLFSRLKVRQGERSNMLGIIILTIIMMLTVFSER